MGKKPLSASGIARMTGCVVFIGTCGFLAEQSFALESGGSVSSAIGPVNYSVGQPASTALGVYSVGTASTIDNAIDENTYYIGGGDRLHIYIVDMPSMNYSCVVTQDYYLIETTLGIIPLGGKVTLARAKEIIVDYMRQKMRGTNNKVRVLLEGVKTSHITAFGSVNSPGTYSFPGTMRLWDVLKSITSANMSDVDFRAVRRKSGDSVAYFDMLGFLYKGDFSQNPYIYPGDELYLVRTTRRVSIGGSGLKAWISGQIPIHPNERLAEFLSFFFFHEHADSEHIFISRTDDGRQYQIITFNLKLKQDFYLQDRDGIIIPQKGGGFSNETYTVSVGGEVVQGGTYPVPKGGTAVQVIIALAGGYTSFADTNRTVVLRMDKKPPPPGMTDGVSRPEMSGALAVAAATKDYLIIRIKEHPETIMKTGDHIWVPRKENMIFISGCVKLPGGYAFTPHKKKEYYIQLAGGFSERADKANIAVVTPYVEAYLSKSTKAEIDAGDIIAVPMKREFKLFERVILPTISMLLSSAGFLIGIVSLVYRR